MYSEITNNFKDNYIFEFLGLSEHHSANELQRGLIVQIENLRCDMKEMFYLCEGLIIICKFNW